MSNLLCCYCGAIYGDPGAEVKSPKCPHCNVSHYEETELNCRMPLKKFVKCSDKDEVIDDNWLPYFILQNITDNMPEIDIKLAHNAGMRLLGRDISTIPWANVLRGLQINSYNRLYKRECKLIDVYEDTDIIDVEYKSVVADIAAELRRLWLEFGYRNTKHADSLDEAINAYKITGSAEELRKYKALKRKLSRFRKNVDLNNLSSV